MRRAAPVASLVAILLAAIAASAQAQPQGKPIRWIVPFDEGTSDALTRGIAQQVGAALRQPIVVENRAADSGIPAITQAARAPADGNTLLTAGLAQLVFHPFVYPKLPYDPRRDFTPVTLIARAPLALFVHSSVPAKSLKELIAHARSRPRGVVFGSPGVGSVRHLAAELLKQRAGLNAVQSVVKGPGPLVSELLAGRVQAAFFPPGAQVLDHVKAGQLRAIALASDKRFASMPGVPTFAEAGVPAFEPGAWIAVVGPAGIPRDAVERLRREIVRAVDSPVVSTLYQEGSLVPAVGTPEQLAALIRREMEVWGPVIRKLGIRAEPAKK